MKTLAKLIVAGCIILTSGSAFAGNPKKAMKRNSMEYALNNYVEAITKGKINAYERAIDDEATFSILRNNRIFTYNKKNEVELLRNMEGVQQNCEAETQVTENNGQFAVVRVNLKYEGFTKINYVTLYNIAGSWKVSSVSTVFE